MKLAQDGHLDFPAALWHSFAQGRAAVRCAPGHLIYLQGTTATCFYYLKSGSVKSYTQSEEGGERLLRIYPAGSLIGAAAFFDELPRISSAVALSVCEVIPIDRGLVSREFSRDPALAMSMVQYLARAVRLLSDQVDDMAFHPAPQRLARTLLLQMGRAGQVATTQEELATAISASRVTVNRILADFTQRGWVETGYGGISVKNTEALQQFLV